VARKLKTLKSVKPGDNEGEFSISLRIQNKGDVELENILVKDKIPVGFSLTETKFNLPYQMLESEIEFKIAEIKGNESMDINFSCSGQGDYPRTEPTVIVLGREGESSEKAAPTPVISKPSELPQSKSAKLNEIFTNFINSVEKGITGIQLSQLIERKRDELPPGPVLHQMMQFAKDLKNNAKMIVGAARDTVLAKLKEFKNKYS
jgi:hypothetical protein